ncbi:MAG: hypothetical protein ACXWV1_02900 [Chitinophagaceae bacterium]
MSSLKDRMYKHEVTPPANAWGKIASALEESQLSNKFPVKLYDIEINPPVNAWEKITGALDDGQFHNEFPSRLYNMEVNPPAAAWRNVAAGLDTASESAATPVKKLFPLVRYAVAAIFIGAVAYGIIKLAVSTGSNQDTAVLTAKPGDSNITKKNKPVDTGATQTPRINLTQNEDEALEQSKQMVARLDRSSLKRGSRRITSSGITTSADEDVTDISLSQSIYAYADHIPDIADRYVMLITPDGNIIRMSKKWSGLLCCVSGEEQDEDCKFQLKKWQEKIASSALAPSPGNFMDILGLVNSLDENNGL